MHEVKQFLRGNYLTKFRQRQQRDMRKAPSASAVWKTQRCWERICDSEVRFVHRFTKLGIPIILIAPGHVPAALCTALRSARHEAVQFDVYTEVAKIIRRLFV